jgi:hypothetical protein
MQKWLSYGCGAFFTVILSEHLMRRPKYNCHPASYRYIVLTYANIVALIIWSKLIDLFKRGPRTRKRMIASIFGLLLSIIFQIVLNMGGMYWMVEAILTKERCLTFLDMFVGFTFQIFTIICVLVGITYLVYNYITSSSHRNVRYARHQAMDPEQIHEMFVRKNLVSIYSRKSVTCLETVKAFIENPNNQDALMKIPVMNEERRMMAKYYTMKIDAHRLKSLSADDEANCSICMGEYSLEDEVYALSCNHTYHTTCFQDWLVRKITCPTCRASIRKDICLRVINEK